MLDAKGNLRDAEKGCGRRTCLSGVAVNGVAPEQQQVVVADLFGAFGKGVSGGEGVCAAESTVGQQVCLVAAERKRLFEHVLCLRRPHADRNDRCAVLFLELDGGLDCVCVEGVDHAGNAVALQIAALVKLDIVRVGHLLYEDKYFHLYLSICSVLCTGHPRTEPLMTMRWISLVPSPISSSFASRYRRSTWNSAL